MKKVLPFFFIFSSVISFGQNFPRTEIATGITTHDNGIPFGNGHFTESTILQNGTNRSGTYSNQTIGAHLNLKFYRSINYAFRIKTSFLSKKIVADYIQLSTSQSSNLSVKQQAIRVAPGFQWGFQQGKIEFFSGAELQLTYVGNTRSDLIEKLPFYSIHTSSSFTGGFGIATGLFLGTTFHVNQFIVLGFELNTSYGYTRVGGNVSNVYKTTNGGTTTEYYYAYNEIINQVGLASLQANFSVGINF
jgi:hypothetical protein